MITEDFSTISRFLVDFAPDVSGRSAALSDELKGQIDRFARGELEEAERKAVSAEVLSNPQAIEALANALRTAA